MDIIQRHLVARENIFQPGRQVGDVLGQDRDQIENTVGHALGSHGDQHEYGGQHKNDGQRHRKGVGQTVSPAPVLHGRAQPRAQIALEILAHGAQQIGENAAVEKGHQDLYDLGNAALHLGKAEDQKEKEDAEHKDDEDHRDDGEIFAGLRVPKFLKIHTVFLSISAQPPQRRAR